MMPDHTRPFQIEIDVSKYATEQYSLNWTPMVTDTPSPLFQKLFLQLKEIMKSMIENYWLLFKHSKNGVIKIQGSAHTTVILSDHKNLMYYREAKKLNQQQA